MIHLKKFNEAFITVDGYYELKKYFKDHLAYLTDKGFTFEFDATPLDKKSDSEITINRSSKEYFMWNDIEDDIIPFLQILNKKYKIKSVIVNKDSNAPLTKGRAFTLKDTLDINFTEWVGILYDIKIVF
jgi:hexokinase